MHNVSIVHVIYYEEKCTAFSRTSAWELIKHFGYKGGTFIRGGAYSREVLIKKLETFTESTLVVAQNSLKSRETE